MDRVILTSQEIEDLIRQDKKIQSKYREYRNLYNTVEYMNLNKDSVDYISNYVLNGFFEIKTDDEDIDIELKKILKDNNFIIEIKKALKTMLITGKSYIQIYQDEEGNTRIVKQNKYNKVINIKNHKDPSKSDAVIRYGYLEKGDKEVLWCELYYKNNSKVYMQYFEEDIYQDLKFKYEVQLIYSEIPIIEFGDGKPYIDKIRRINNLINENLEKEEYNLRTCTATFFTISNAEMSDEEMPILDEEKQKEYMQKKIREKQHMLDTLTYRLREGDITLISTNDKVADNNILKSKVEAITVPNILEDLTRERQALLKDYHKTTNIPDNYNDSLGSNKSGEYLRLKYQALDNSISDYINNISAGIHKMMDILQNVILIKTNKKIEDYTVKIEPIEIKDYHQEIDYYIKLLDAGLIDRKSVIEKLKIGNPEQILENIKNEQQEEIGYDNKSGHDFLC